jgi:hypothetical protein
MPQACGANALKGNHAMLRNILYAVLWATIIASWGAAWLAFIDIIFR